MPRSFCRAPHGTVRPELPAAWVYYTLTIVGVVAAVVSAVILIQMRVERSSASFSAAATDTYNEDFSAVTYKDAATTLNWNTSVGQLELNRASGVVRNFDLSTAGVQPVITTGSYNEFIGHSSIQIDSSFRQNLAFIGDSGSSVDAAKFTRWDGTQLVNAAGVAGSDVVSSFPTRQVFNVSLAINPTSERPYVAYTQDDAGTVSQVYLAMWNGSAWVGPVSGAAPDAITAAADDQSNVYLAFGPNAEPVLAWEDGAGFSGDIMVAHLTSGTYQGFLGASPDNLTSTPAVLDSQPVVQVGSDNLPDIIWNSGGPSEILYTQFASGAYRQLNGSTAGTSNISNTATNSLGVDMRLNASDQPLIVYTEALTATNRPLRFTMWNGTTLTAADGTTAGFETISTSDNNTAASIDLDSSGNPGVCWIFADVDGGEPGEVVCSLYNPDLNDWVQPTDRTTSGQLNISASTGIFNFAVSAAFDQFDDLDFVYDEEVSGVRDLFGGLIVRDRTNGLALSTPVDTVSGNILSATITATETLRGGTDVYSLSNDCSTFAAATLGSPLTFSTTGSSLCWKVDVTRNPSDPRLAPVVDALSISYTTPEVVVTQPSGETVTRIEGNDPTEQSIKVSQAEFADHTADCGIVARNDNMSDAFVGAQLSTSKNAPILLNRTDKLDDAVKTELQRALKPSACIFVLGREVAQADQVISDIRGAGFVDVTRLGGRDRRETALRIDNKLFGDGLTSGRVVLAEDLRFVDTLGMSAIDADVADGKVDPTILTDRGQATLNSFAKQYLTNHASAVSEVVIIGGDDAVPTSMDQTIKSLLPSATVTRVAGDERYATNAKINTTYAPAPTAIVVASGNRSAYPAAESLSGAAAPAPNPALTGDSFFFAALLSGPFAAKLHAPLLLTESGALPGQIETYIRDHAATITSATIIGTLEQISQAVQDFIGSII
ncbi:MAG: cell wall-binding repeat-containing protein [Candidatus Andersenbacteria bacterium]